MGLAEDLQNTIPELQSTTTRWVAYAIRDHVAAGWTLKDLLDALEWQPIGTRWPRNHIGHAAYPERVLMVRLDAWRKPVSEPSSGIRLTKDGQRVKIGAAAESPTQTRSRRRAEELARRALVQARLDAEAVAARQADAALQPIRDAQGYGHLTPRAAAKLRAELAAHAAGYVAEP